MGDSANLRKSVELNTKRGGPWLASDGVVHEYKDMLGAFMSSPYHWRRYFEDRLVGKGLGGIVVGGRSGAFLAGFLAGWLPADWSVAILNIGKDHGLVYNGELPEWGTKVALVDDIRVTGHTLGVLRSWAESNGLVVVDELVGWPTTIIQNMALNQVLTDGLNKSAD